MAGHWLRAGERVLAALLVAGSLASCATVFNHEAQEVAIAPEASGRAIPDPGPVRVLITSNLGTYRTALPVRFVVTPDTWSRVTVKVVEPCYKQTERALPRSVTWWIWGDALGGAVGAGVGAIFPFLGDGLDGTLWSYDRDVRVPIERVENFEACLAESRKKPDDPFVVSRDPVWQDARVYPVAKQGGSPVSYPTQH